MSHRSLLSFSTADLAACEGRAALKQELLHRTGVLKIPELVAVSPCERLRAAALQKAVGQPFDCWPGVRSKRILDPLEWGGAAIADVINEIAEKTTDLFEEVLGPRAWITSVQALALFPTSFDEMSAEQEAELVAGSLHNDYPWGEFKEGMDRALEGTSSSVPSSEGGWQFPVDFHQPRTLQMIVVLDEFTRERGATRVLPGSARFRCRQSGGVAVDHTTSPEQALSGLACRIPHPSREEDIKLFDEHHVAAEGQIGDAIVYIGHTWHTIAVNRGSSPRVALLLQISPFYLAPLEAAAWMTPSWVQRDLTSVAKQLLSLPGTTIEGAGGKGEESSHVPHRCEPRPLASCAGFAVDTVLRLGRRKAAPVMIPCVVGVMTAAWISSQLQMRTGRGSPIVSVAVSTLLLGAGYLLGVTATIRRLEF